jgi:hypothetical protein
MKSVQYRTPLINLSCLGSSKHISGAKPSKSRARFNLRCLGSSLRPSFHTYTYTAAELLYNSVVPAPNRVLNRLHESQEGPQRHNCTECAFEGG